MEKFYFHHIRTGDIEVPEQLFKLFIDFIQKKDSKGFRKFQVVTISDDSEDNVIYYYSWSRNSDFLYLGYCERS